LIARRRTFVVALLGCSIVCWNGIVCSQPATSVPVGNLDAASAASNSASLPPPAPLPQSTLQALDSPALPALPAAPPSQLPALPAPAVEPAVTPAPLQGAPAPLLTLPALPSGTSAPVVAPVTESATAAPTVTLPGAAPVVQSDVPPVMLPSGPAPVPNVIEPAKEMAPSNDVPLVSTASGGSLPPTLPRYEILALEKHPLPKVTPSSPLIPAPGLSETTNQRRQLTTLPGSGGDTNYAYATLGGPEGPPKPWVTPPTVLETKVGLDIGKDYPPLQAVMPQPQATPLRWDEPESAFGTPVPASALNYYVSKTLLRNPDESAINPAPSLAEIIVLRGGQEFEGLILERGDMWRIELLNGAIINVPGNKVSHVRKILAVPTSTPSARNMAFPPQELYKTRATTQN